MFGGHASMRSVVSVRFWAGYPKTRSTFWTLNTSNKHARILWSMLVHGQSFNPEHAVTKQRVPAGAS
jgi:hypothetical protein